MVEMLLEDAESNEEELDRSLESGTDRFQQRAASAIFWRFRHSVI